MKPERGHGNGANLIRKIKGLDDGWRSSVELVN